MLTQKDKQWISEEFSKAIKKQSEEDRQWLVDEVFKMLHAFLVFEIDVEKGPDKQGDPEKVMVKEKINVLAFLAKYLPDIEGRMLGMQKNVCQARNKVFKQNDLIRSVAQTLITMEGSAKKIAQLSDYAQQAKPELYLESDS